MSRNPFTALLLLLMLAVSPVGRAANIWQGSEAISWSGGGNVQLPATSFSTAQVADIVRLTIQFTGNTDWPQVSLRDGSWQDLPCAGGTPLKEGMTTVDYYVTTAMLASLQQSGLLITGIGYTLLAVDIVEGGGGAGLEKAVWIGSTVLPNDWSGYQQLPASCFAGAAVGQMVRLSFKDLLGGAQAILRTGDWTDMPDMDSFVQLSGLHADIAITAAMLAKLKSGGCIVQGVGFTLTTVELVGDEDLSKLQFSVPVLNEWVWKSPEAPVFRVNVTNPTDAEVTFETIVRITDDKHTATKDYTTSGQLIAEGQSQAFDYTLGEPLAPGFYQATILVNGEVARSFVFGQDPEQLVSEPDMQADFADFWQQTRQQLAQHEGSTR